MGENTSLHLPMCLISLEAGQTIPSVPRLFCSLLWLPPPQAGSESHDHPRMQAGQPRAPKPLVPDRQLVLLTALCALGTLSGLVGPGHCSDGMLLCPPCLPPPPQSLLGYSCSSARSHHPGKTASLILFSVLLFPAFALWHPLRRILPSHLRATFLPPFHRNPSPSSLIISDCFLAPVIIQILSGQSSRGCPAGGVRQWLYYSCSLLCLTFPDCQSKSVCAVCS